MARSGCIYGPTGSFKTTAIAHLAHYIAQKLGKATLLLSADNGGWESCSDEVKVGMIRPYRCDPDTIPLPIIRKVSQGFWPVNPEETDVSKLNFMRVNFDDIGAIAVEGFTSIGSMMMRYVADKAVNTGQEAVATFVQDILVNGEVVKEKFSGNSKAHFNFCHNQLFSMTTQFTSWPVEYVLFTGLEKKTDDDGSTIFGVSVPGKAITPQIPSWVGDLIHAQDYPVERAVKVPNPSKPGELIDGTVVDTICRYYFRKHPDPATGIMFPAKPRIAHGAVKDLDKKFPGGYFEPTTEAGFDIYLRAIDELSGKPSSLEGWREKMDKKLGRKVPSAAVVEVARNLQ